MDKYSPKNSEIRVDDDANGVNSASPMLQGSEQTTFYHRNKMRIIVALVVVLVVITCGTTVGCLFRNTRILGYPLHAECNITWTFKSSCDQVQDKLVQQIEKWRTNATCGTGQKCLYDLVSRTPTELKATHTTPVRRYIDDMMFTFYPNPVSKGCNVVGFSTSRLWYAVLDYGTNYCNLHNLVDGAGLQSDENYSEVTKDSDCTQYTSSNCEKY